MAKELPMKTSWEHDALSGWRRVLGWHPGMRALQKRSYNKRVRRETKRELRIEMNRGDQGGSPFAFQIGFVAIVSVGACSARFSTT